jgi:hypothetical protein
MLQFKEKHQYFLLWSWIIILHICAPTIKVTLATLEIRCLLDMEAVEAPGIDQIPAELIQAGGIHYVLRSTNLLCLE